MTTLIVTMTVSPDRPRGEVQARTTVRNLEGIPRFQLLCERFGITPTYFLTYPVLLNDRATWFRDCASRGRCELGITLEPWTTPPFDANEDRLKEHTANSIPPYAVARKMASLVQRFEAAIGRSPTAHRASGYGLCGATLQALEAHGIVVDSSVAPYHDGRDVGSVDWRRSPATPYHPDRQRPAQRGASPVLEVPLTFGYDRDLPEPIARLLAESSSWLPIGHVFGTPGLSLCEFVGLAPGQYQLPEMQRLADARIRAAVPQLILEITSAFLQPGESAYSMTHGEADRNFEAIDAMFRYVIDRHHLKPAGLIEFAQGYVRPDVKPA